MATQSDIPPAPPSAQVVCNAFVEQYYHILHHSTELVYRFYQDSSVISRPEPDGGMTSVTTMKGINDKICSMDYKNYMAEIKTADAQDSFKDGVIVLVTGCLTGIDNLRRKFTQTFFLAPQDKGYFVLNDVFRYIDENDPLDANTIAISGIDEALSASLTVDPEPSHVLDPPVPDQEKSHVKELPNVDGKPDISIENESQLVNNKKDAVVPESQPTENHISAVLDPATSNAEEDTPKKSYASIVSSQTKKGNSGTLKYVPTNTSKVAPQKTEKPSLSSISQDPAPAASVPIAPGNSNATENSTAQDEGDSYSIYIKNLPLNVTPNQLETEFKKFGPIKQGGVQVRSNKHQGFCFGFVEFQDLNSMNNAIQASPITIGDRQAAVEIKRTTTRVGNTVGTARGRYPSGRGWFRNDNFRGRGNYGGQGYGRNDFGGRGDFSGRGRGPGGRSGEGNQQGRGRGGRRNAPTQNAAVAAT